MSRTISIMLQTLLYGFVTLLVVVPLGGWIYQSMGEMRDTERFPPPGERFHVDGHLMHIHCQGQGSPTVIVEQGIGAQSLGWRQVNEMMSRTTRVCAYDRVGMGYSQPIARPTPAKEVAQNLSWLLGAANIDDDLVLVGWSAGGMYIREYYRQFPERVKGMVLVDSSHEQQRKRMPNPDEDAPFNPIRAYRYLAPFGWVRFSGMIDQQFASSPLPPDERDRLKAVWLKSHTYRTLVAEGEGFESDLAKGAAPPKLGDIPLVVLVEGKPNIPFMQQNLEKWMELQRELAALSSNSKLVVAANSAHAIHRTEPELIVDAVTQVATAVRTGGRIDAEQSADARH